MLKATTTYNPRLNPENSKSRRNVVLSNLLRKKFLTHEEYDSLSELPIELKYTPVKPTDGKAPYFRDVLADELQNGWCKDNDKDLYGDGLRIYTTIDSRMQKYAEEAVMKHMQQVQRNFKSDWAMRIRGATRTARRRRDLLRTSPKELTTTSSCRHVIPTTLIR